MIIGNMFLKLSCILCMIGVLDATSTPKSEDCYTRAPGRGSNNRVMTCLDKYAIVPGHLFCQTSKPYRPLSIQGLSENERSLKYNHGLERVAYIWGQRCALKSSRPFQRFRPGAFAVGENVHVSRTNLSWSDVIDKWAEEKSAFTFGSAGISLKGVSNYIQLIWAKTSTVGCSKAVCAGQYFYVCHYASAMDYDNFSMPYKSTTKSCARCSKNCTNSLCDCSDVTCLNGAELNLQTCQCECIANVHTYSPPLCDLSCERDGDDPSCGRVYQKSTCRSSFETMFHCPWMCELCPYAGKNYTERSQPLPWERNRTECPELTTDSKTTSQHGISTNAQSSESDHTNGRSRGNGSSRISFLHSTAVFVFMLTLDCISK